MQEDTNILEGHAGSIFTLKMEPAGPSERVKSYIITWCHKPEDHNIIHCHVFYKPVICNLEHIVFSRASISVPTC
jgi:hypothetical protein